jgi:hypothetical protein
MFILSLIAFVIAVLPLKNTAALIDYKSMKDARNSALGVKYASVLIGVGLFIAALFMSILVFLGFVQ